MFEPNHHFHKLHTELSQSDFDAFLDQHFPLTPLDHVLFGGPSLEEVYREFKSRPERVYSDTLGEWMPIGARA